MKTRRLSIDRKILLQLLALLAFVAVMFTVSYFAPLGDWVDTFAKWIRSHPVAGPLIYILVFAAWIIFLLPGILMIVASGLVFGLGWGIPIAIIAVNLGQWLAFLCSRYLMRKTVEKFAKKHKNFHKIDRAIGTHGWQVVGLLRFSPIIPDNLLNYFFGITKVKFWIFAAANFVAVLPGIVFYTYVGYAGDMALTSHRPEHQNPLYVGIGLLVTALISLYLGWIGKEALAHRTKS